jgi:hypothetical protein
LSESSSLELDDEYEPHSTISSLKRSLLREMDEQPPPTAIVVVVAAASDALGCRRSLSCFPMVAVEKECQ